MEHEHVPVLVVGAGPAGLTAALLLARASVPVLLVERHASTSVHPRARGLNLRTMEILRAVDLEDTVRVAGAALELSRYMLFVETLAGREIRRVADDDLVATGDALDAWTPCNWCQCAQDELEPILLAAARDHGADIRFSTELIGLVQDADGATATLADRATGLQHAVRAQYVIAADGARSPLRAMLDVPLRIDRTLEHYVNIYFRADLRALVQDRWFGICFVENEISPGLFLAVNNTDRWLFNVEYQPQQGQSPDNFTPARCVELVRGAVGVPNLDVAIISVLPWEMAAQIVAQFQVGRVFFAGDAAHVMPPAGGFGLNTGVQDAHNLAWKLAAVLRGTAAPALLATYAAEREPTANMIVAQAVAEVEAPTPDGPPSGYGPPDGDHGGPPAGPPGGYGNSTAMLVPVLGYHYDSAAIVADGAMATDEGLDLTGRPGTRAPHVWIEHAGVRCSTLDLFDGRFVLLTGPDGSVWYDVAHAAAQRTGLDLAAYCVGGAGEIGDPSGSWAAAYGVSPSGAVLVRPDSFVGWRAHGAAANAEQVVEQALNAMLGR